MIRIYKISLNNLVKNQETEKFIFQKTQRDQGTDVRVKRLNDHRADRKDWMTMQRLSSIKGGVA